MAKSYFYSILFWGPKSPYIIRPEGIPKFGEIWKFGMSHFVVGQLPIILSLETDTWRFPIISLGNLDQFGHSLHLWLNSCPWTYQNIILLIVFATAFHSCGPPCAGYGTHEFASLRPWELQQYQWRSAGNSRPQVQWMGFQWNRISFIILLVLVFVDKSFIFCVAFPIFFMFGCFI